MAAPSIRRALVLLLILPGLPLGREANGQTPETDSVAVFTQTDSVATEQPPAQVPQKHARPTPAWFPARPERRLTESPMVQTRFADAAEVLAEDPLFFLYQMGIPGRPTGASHSGLPPSVMSATLNDFEFVDPLTRMPLLELLPFELLEPLSTSWSRTGFGQSISARTRAMAGRPPLTEVRYHQGSDKLQSISAFHSQDRTRTVRNEPTRLNFLFRYGGRGFTGTYPGSKTRLRQIYLRLIHEKPGRLLETSYLRTRADRGGQSGVLPATGRPFNSIYETFSPTVRTRGATSRIDRHDIAIRLRTDISSPLPPLTAGIRLTPQVNESTFPAAAYRVPSLQAGYFLFQPLGKIAGHSPELVHILNVVRIRGHAAFSDSSAARYTDWSIGLRDSLRTLGGSMLAEALIQSTTKGPRPRVQAAYVREVRSAAFRVETAWGYRNPSHVERFGWGSALAGLEDAQSGSVASTRASTLLRFGTIVGEFGLHASSLARPIDYSAHSSLLASSGTQATVIQEERTHRWAGGSAGLSWRQDARSGLYARAGAVFTLPSASVTQSGPHASTTLPKWRGEGQIGTRSRLFEGDLRLTTFLRGRAWSAFRSRAFQPETGLFVLPAADDLLFGPSGSLDVIAEGGVRTATLFLTVENVLSGTVYPGTLLVPLYPLPKRALRFGVYWPLLN